jgi:hypothetical protein
MTELSTAVPQTEPNQNACRVTIRPNLEQNF